MADVRVVLVAEEAAGVQTLRALLGSGAELVAVYTSGTPEGMRGATVARVAAAQGVAVRDEILCMDAFAAALGDAGRFGDEDMVRVKNVAEPLRYRHLLR